MTQMQYDKEKMRAVILRACHTCTREDLGAVKLKKVLYYFDMISYAHHRASGAGATYRQRPNGPTSDQLLFLLRDMARVGDIDILEVDYHGFFKKEYIAKVAEPVGVLNSDEIELLDDVIEFVCRQNTARSISEYSHSLPWEMAEMGATIPYRSALLLFPSQPSPEAFEAVQQGEPELAARRSARNTVGMSKLADFRGRILAASGQS